MSKISFVNGNKYPVIWGFVHILKGIYNGKSSFGAASITPTTVGAPASYFS